MDNEREDWKSCYSALRQSLTLRGVESPFGEGDFWLVDDDYGGFDQKICVFRLEFLRHELVVDIQRVLKASNSQWRVVLVLEVPKLLAAKHEEGGLFIYHDHVEEHWDRRRIEAILGASLSY